MSGVETVEREVRELVRRRGIDPVTEQGVVRLLVDEVLADYDERSLSSALPPISDARGAARSVFDAVAGFGPLQRHLDDESVEEVWINGPGRVFVARHGRSELTTTILTEQEVRDLVEKMLKSTGRRVDLSQPFVDAMMPDGSRLHVVIPDITRSHWSVNIRKFVIGAHSVDDLVALGTATPQVARFLEAAVVAGLNIIVAGGTQAGKTTLLNCLAGAIPGRERVISCEEVFELKLGNTDWVAMQTRQPNLEGTGEIPLRRLVKESLRMRPDRILVGEVRQEECLDLLIALNSGFPGSGSHTTLILMQRRALVYVRISQDREGAGLGVARQRQDCQELVERLAWQLVEVYVDNDVSASTGRVRPSYRRLLQDLSAGRGDAVVTWHPDRLHRSPRELEEFIDIVEKSGSAVATVRAGDLDLGTPAGRAVARTLGAWARYEVEAKSERQKRKVQELVAAGQWAGGGRPFGYEADGCTVRDTEAAVLLDLSQRALTGESLGSLARDLNDRGVKTSTGRAWSATPMRQLLVRPRNAGLREHDGQVVGPAVWQAVVPEDTWRELCVVLKDPSRRRSTDNRVKWLGAGLYRCGVCGDVCRSATASNRDGSRRMVYRCKKLGRDGERHAARSAIPVDELVSETVLARLARPDAVDLLQPQDDGAGTAAELGQARQRLQTAAADYADGLIDREQLTTITERLRGKILNLEAQLPRQESAATASLLEAGKLAHLVWTEMSVAQRREAVDTLLEVTLLPVSGRAPRLFDPASVRLTWR